MFLSQMENSIPCYLEIKMLMILNVMKVVYRIDNYEVDSINFKNAIIQSQLPFELSEFEKDIEEMIIEEEYGYYYYGNLRIENYPNLQSIIVKKESLMNLNSLKICNCEKLKIIETGYYAFSNVKRIIIESISKLILNFYISPIYNHSKQEIYHSVIYRVYLYRVILSNSTLVHIFLIYNHLKQEK